MRGAGCAGSGCAGGWRRGYIQDRRQRCPAVVTAGGSATVSATVYSRSETDGEWSEYLGGGAVITWQAYREGVAAFRGEDADKPVTTALNADLPRRALSC